MRSTGTGPAVTKSHPANPGQRRKTEPRYLHPGPTGQPCFHSPQRFRPDKGQQADGRQDRRQQAARLAHGGKATAGLPPRPMPPACPVVAHARRYPPASHLARCHRLARWWLTLAATRRPPTSPDATGLPGGGSRSPLPAGLPPRPMPPACPVVAHARRYPPASHRARCHRLARWWLTLAATRRPPPRPMPPACPVVAHARRYPPASHPARCHRLARWWLTLAATRRPPTAHWSPPKLQRTFGDWRRRGPCNRAEPNNPPGKPVGF